MQTPVTIGPNPPASLAAARPFRGYFTDSQMLHLQPFFWRGLALRWNL